MTPPIGKRTLFEPIGDKLACRCPECHTAETIMLAKARVWFRVFSIRCFAVGPQSLVWLCTRCDWNTPNEPGGWQPTRSLTQGSNTVRETRPKPAGELNKLYQLAEQWHRPPSPAA
ncbi:hypothetical protein BDN71DRAFT_1194846 [Pleurotus eryngii]|uniref:Zinc-ribbon 15 domain-containing protein n=1 Tax=Pleurotus eryngii TaxID=5323 RepID=A0A9P6DK56_PLEER|nr:hypothetical protein BDN71DRAFT_1194846 [Pleurotus eryngii]